MDAAKRLCSAFRQRSAASSSDERPLVGVFGDGLPEALVAACGGRPVEVKAPPLDEELQHSDAVSRIAEPFLDEFASVFLHRLATGAFDSFAALIFARDDTAALTAYQYASELRRQRRIAREGPRLHLWNLLHTDSAAAHAFNMDQAARLVAFLGETLAIPADENRATAMFAAEADRLDAVNRMEAHRIGGANEFVWRNAGRWLAPEVHAGLLDAALAEETSLDPVRSIGLVGTACDVPDVHRICERFGRVVVDLQPYGKVWPRCHAGGPDLDGLMQRVATEPLNIRINPPHRFGAALVDELKECDAVVVSYDANDDSFGWEVPSLRKALAARNIPLVDLGFRPFRPDQDWCREAADRIAEALT